MIIFLIISIIIFDYQIYFIYGCLQILKDISIMIYNYGSKMYITNLIPKFFANIPK